MQLYTFEDYTFIILLALFLVSLNTSPIYYVCFAVYYIVDVGINSMYLKIALLIISIFAVALTIALVDPKLSKRHCKLVEVTGDGLYVFECRRGFISTDNSDMIDQYFDSL